MKTYAMFLQIEDSDGFADPADRLIRVAILTEDHTLEDMNHDFEEILDHWEHSRGYRPAELDT